MKLIILIYNAFFAQIGNNKYKIDKAQFASSDMSTTIIENKVNIDPKLPLNVSLKNIFNDWIAISIKKIAFANETRTKIAPITIRGIKYLLPPDFIDKTRSIK